MAGDNSSCYEESDDSMFERSADILDLIGHKCPLCAHAHDNRTTCAEFERRCEMIIRENIPEELPPDVVRCNSRSDAGLEAVQIDLTSLRQRFESGSDSDGNCNDNNNGPTKCVDLEKFPGLQRSESVFLRLQRYQSAVAGDRKMSCCNGDGRPDEDLSDGDTGADEQPFCHESKRKEKVIPFAGLSALKSQWESGSFTENNNNDIGSDGESAVDADVKEELFKLRQRICLGRSASMRQIYENGCPIEVPRNNLFSAGDSGSGKAKAVAIRERFEKGQVDETDGERLKALRQEKLSDLSVVAEADTAAREAKKLFAQMDASHRPAAVNGSLSRSRTISAFRSAQSPPTPHPQTLIAADPQSLVPVVRHSDPAEAEDVLIDTTALQERYKFFEEFRQPAMEPKRFEMTPPRETAARSASPVEEETPHRDPNVVRASDVIDDLPKSDTTKKMLGVFKQLESQTSSSAPASRPEPKPLKRVTPPRELDVAVAAADRNGPLVENDAHHQEEEPEIVRSSIKSEDVIPVEPEMARSLRAKFENWATEVERENNKNHNGAYDLPNDYTPTLDTAKNLKAKFESFRKNDPNNQPPLEKRKPRVNRFVWSKSRGSSAGSFDGSSVLL